MAKILCTLLIGMLALPAGAVDAERVFKSLVLPGMGQLGDGQTVKGLAIMAAEVACLSVVFGEMGKASAYAHETYVLQVKYGLGGDYSQINKNYTDWQDAYHKSKKARGFMLVAGASAGGVWALNLLDALLFAPKKKALDDEESLLNVIDDHLVVRMSPESARVSFVLDF